MYLVFGFPCPDPNLRKFNPLQSWNGRTMPTIDSFSIDQSIAINQRVRARTIEELCNSRTLRVTAFEIPDRSRDFRAAAVENRCNSRNFRVTAN